MKSIRFLLVGWLAMVSACAGVDDTTEERTLEAQAAVEGCPTQAQVCAAICWGEALPTPAPPGCPYSTNCDCVRRCGGTTGQTCPANLFCVDGICQGAPNSCHGRCGSYDPSTCSCDVLCGAYGDCCADYVAACTAP
jgi:hypothetical protein